MVFISADRGGVRTHTHTHTYIIYIESFDSRTGRWRVNVINRVRYNILRLAFRCGPRVNLLPAKRFLSGCTMSDVYNIIMYTRDILIPELCIMLYGRNSRGCSRGDLILFCVFIGFGFSKNNLPRFYGLNAKPWKRYYMNMKRT